MKIWRFSNFLFDSESSIDENKLIVHEDDFSADVDTVLDLNVTLNALPTIVFVSEEDVQMVIVDENPAVKSNKFFNCCQEYVKL